MDLLTPLVIMPLAWWILDGTGGLHGRALVAFLVIAALWVEAQGIHLAANAIGDAFNAGPERRRLLRDDRAATSTTGSTRSSATGRGTSRGSR